MSNQLYQEYEDTPAWDVIDEGISALVANQDIKELTHRRNIVGYLVKRLVEAKVIMATKQPDYS
jgi:hypothetical protein